MVNLYCLIGMFIVVAKCIFWIIAIRKFEIRLSNAGFLAAVGTLVLDLIMWPINLTVGIVAAYSKSISKMLDYMYED